MASKKAPTTLPVTVEDIRRAAGTIKGAVIDTRFEKSRTLSGIAGADIWLKFENLQFTAAYKERGALNRLSSLTGREKAAASSPCRPAIMPRVLPITHHGSAFRPPS